MPNQGETPKHTKHAEEILSLQHPGSLRKVWASLHCCLHDPTWISNGLTAERMDGNVTAGSIVDFGQTNHSVIAISDCLRVCHTLRWQTALYISLTPTGSSLSFSGSWCLSSCNAFQSKRLFLTACPPLLTSIRHLKRTKDAYMCHLCSNQF